MKKILLFLCLLASTSIWAAVDDSRLSVDSLITDSTFTLSSNYIFDTIPVDPFNDNYFSQVTEIQHLSGNAFVLGIEVIEVDIPSDWEVYFCGYNTSNAYGTCELGPVNQVFVQNNDFVELIYNVQGSSISQTATATVTMDLYDVNTPTCIERVKFHLTLDASNIPDPSTGFAVSSTSSQVTHFEINPNEQIWDFNNIEIYNTNFGNVELAWKVLDQQIPSDWSLEYYSFHIGNQFFENQAVPLEGTFVLPPNQSQYIEMGTGLISSNGVPGTRSVDILVYDQNDSLAYNEILNFSFTIEVPEASSGFSISSNESVETYLSYSVDESIALWNNIEIYNENNGPVELAWKVLDQFNPPAWTFNHYAFSLPYNYFDNTPIPTTGTFSLAPNEYQYIEMQTELFSHNGVEGTRSVEILIYDVNDSLNYNEVLTFNANIELAESGESFMVFNENEMAYFEPTTPDEPAHFHHIPIDVANNNLFQEIVIGWELITDEHPEDWIMDDELLFMSAGDFQHIVNPNQPLSGTFTLAPGDYGNIEYIIHQVEHNNVSGTGILEILLYDMQDSAATAVLVRRESHLNLPEVGTGFEVPETYSGSIHTVSDPNEPIFMYLSPLFVTNYTDNIVELAWKKVAQTIPSEWQVQYDFNAHYDYYNSFVPEGGNFNLLPYEEAYFALNYNEVFTNGLTGAAELQILVYDKNDSLNYNEILTFRSSVCVADNDADIIIPPSQNSFCEGEMITLESVAGLENITWFNGSNASSITIPVQEVVYLEAEDADGCPLSQALNFDIAYPYAEAICVVSVDEASGKNVVIWEKTSGQSTSHYNVYKETEQANQYTLVGTQAYEELSSYIDEASNPNEASNRYKIAAVNDCGAESPLSTDHKTMHLTINTSNNGDINLIWDRYEGFDYPTFNILRGASSSSMQLIAQRPSNTFTYTDIAPPSGDLFYQIEIIYPNGCTPSAHAVSGTRSNIADNIMVSTQIIVDHTISVFPNPFDTEIQLRDIPSDVYRLELMDVSGTIRKRQAIQSTSCIVTADDLANGLYFIRLYGEQTYVVKVVK